MLIEINSGDLMIVALVSCRDLGVEEMVGGSVKGRGKAMQALDREDKRDQRSKEMGTKTKKTKTRVASSRDERKGKRKKEKKK